MVASPKPDGSQRSLSLCVWVPASGVVFGARWIVSACLLLLTLPVQPTPNQQRNFRVFGIGKINSFLMLVACASAQVTALLEI